VQFDQEGMTVQASAFVPFGHIRQTVGRFDIERLEDAHGRVSVAGDRSL
jgi:hypothetical protein